MGVCVFKSVCVCDRSESGKGLLTRPGWTVHVRVCVCVRVEQQWPHMQQVHLWPFNSSPDSDGWGKRRGRARKEDECKGWWEKRQRWRKYKNLNRKAVMRGKVDAQDSMRRRWMSPKEDDGRRWKWKREKAFWPDSELTEWQNETWMCEEKKVDGMEQKSEGLQVKECSQVKVIRRVERTDRVVSHSTGLSPCLSTSLPLSLSSGGWHFSSSVWPVTEGGMNRGVERGERAGWAEKKGAEERMSSRRTSKCSPADLLEERACRGRHTNKNRDASSLHKMQQHICW